MSVFVTGHGLTSNKCRCSKFAVCQRFKFPFNDAT